MVDTLEELILQDIKTQLETISIGAGYYTDVARVYRAETDNTEELPDLPGVVMVHGGSERADDRLGMIKVEMRVDMYPVVELLDPDGWNSAVQLFVADVERKLREDITRGGSAFDTKVTSVGIPQVDTEASRAAGRVEATIRFRHVYADPTTSI